MIMATCKNRPLHHGTAKQYGFSLVELMVGLVIGLLATLVIIQVFSTFEGQKRSTSGSSDAQTNGSIALMSIQRNVQMAGYGLPLPMADKINSVLKHVRTPRLAQAPFHCFLFIKQPPNYPL